MNDLSKTEKEIMKAVRFELGRQYKDDDLLEWSNSEARIDKNLRDGERKVNVMGLWVAVRDRG